MDIIRLVEEKVLSVTTKVLKVLEGEISDQAFESVLKEELDELDQEFYQSKGRRKDWDCSAQGCFEDDADPLRNT